MVYFIVFGMKIAGSCLMLVVTGHKQQEHTAAGDRVILPILLLQSKTACIACLQLPILSRWDNRACMEMAYQD